MARLPQTSGKRLVQALGKIGWSIHHQKGSHAVIKSIAKPDSRITVPMHKTIKKGTLSGILKDAGITGDELRNLL